MKVIFSRETGEVCPRDPASSLAQKRLARTDNWLRQIQLSLLRSLSQQFCERDTHTVHPVPTPPPSMTWYKHIPSRRINTYHFLPHFTCWFSSSVLVRELRHCGGLSCGDSLFWRERTDSSNWWICTWASSWQTIIVFVFSCGPPASDWICSAFDGICRTCKCYEMNASRVWDSIMWLHVCKNVFSSPTSQNE